MKKYKFILLLSGLLLSTDTLEFKYGILLAPSEAPDNFIALEDSASVYTGDKIRINIATHGYSFYVIFLSADNQYQRVYSIHTPYSKKELYDEPLRSGTLEDPPGWDILYLINSKEHLTELERSIDRYDRSKGKVREKLGKKIQNILDGLYPQARNLAYFNSRLDEPVLGGVSTRGDDDKLSRYASTHSCKGNEQIALRKIVLNHQKKKQ